MKKQRLNISTKMAKTFQFRTIKIKIKLTSEGPKQTVRKITSVSYW